MECLCFSIRFPYYENSLFPCFRNGMDFWFTENMQETHTFGIFVFSHNFLLQWEFTFLMFCELNEFLLHTNYVRNPYPFNDQCSHHIDTSHMICSANQLTGFNIMGKLVIKGLTLEYFCFPIRSLCYKNSLSHVLGTILLM